MSLRIHNSDAINAIGRDAGVKLWADLSPEEQTEKYQNDQEKHYYKGVILPPKGTYPPMLAFQNIGEYGYYPGNSIYCINLKTGKPTLSSSIKTVPKAHLISSLYDNGGNVLDNYFKKMPV